MNERVVPPPEPDADAGGITKGRRSRAAGTGQGFTELISLQWQNERSDLDLDNFLLAIYLMRLGTLVERAMDEMCIERWGIGIGDMRVLFALRRGGAPYVKRPTDLFKALLVTSGAMTKKVDRLKQAGYAERSADPNHSGGFLIYLTRKGLNAVDQATEVIAKESVLVSVMEQLSIEERKQFSGLALRVLATLEQQNSGKEAPV